MSEREKQVTEFLANLTKNDALVKPIYNPEAFLMREKARGAANRGDIQRTGCRHPLSEIRQFVDEDPSVKRNDKLVNLFECGVCHMLLWFADPWSEPISDD